MMTIYPIEVVAPRWLNPDLTLGDLSKGLNTNRTTLSLQEYSFAKLPILYGMHPERVYSADSGVENAGIFTQNKYRTFVSEYGFYMYN